MKLLKGIAKIAIGLIIILPVLLFSIWAVAGIVIFVLILAIVIRLTGGNVNLNINTKENC